MRILGLPADDYIQTIQFFKKYKFVIYSGAVDWGKRLHPNILISHGITWDAPTKNVTLKYIFNIFSNIDYIVSVDTNTISWLRTTFPFDFEDREMRYIPNYVDTSLYKPLSRDETIPVQITFPRRASPERGYWLMSKALPIIMEKYPHAEFNFVGFAHGKKVKSDMQKLIDMFPGRIRHYVCEPSDMYQIYQKTDISLIPTLYAEGTSLSCLEAQACGNVVISTNIGGLPNLILDGYNGLLINPCAADLVCAIDKVIADKELREKLSANAVQVAKSFDKIFWGNKWKDVIKKISKDE